jgi:hypothetical protein
MEESKRGLRDGLMGIVYGKERTGNCIQISHLTSNLAPVSERVTSYEDWPSEDEFSSYYKRQNIV